MFLLRESDSVKIEVFMGVQIFFALEHIEDRKGFEFYNRVESAEWHSPTIHSLKSYTDQRVGIPTVYLQSSDNIFEPIR